MTCLGSSASFLSAECKKKTTNCLFRSPVPTLSHSTSLMYILDWCPPAFLPLPSHIFLLFVHAQSRWLYTCYSLPHSILDLQFCLWCCWPFSQSLFILFFSPKLFFKRSAQMRDYGEGRKWTQALFLNDKIHLLGKDSNCFQKRRN